MMTLGTLDMNFKKTNKSVTLYDDKEIGKK